MYFSTQFCIPSPTRQNMLAALLSWVVMLLVFVVCGWVGWWLLLKPYPPPASVTRPYSSPSLLYPLKVAVFYCLVKLRKVSVCGCIGNLWRCKGINYFGIANCHLFMMQVEYLSFSQPLSHLALPWAIPSRIQEKFIPLIIMVNFLDLFNRDRQNRKVRLVMECAPTPVWKRWNSHSLYNQDQRWPGHFFTFYLARIM